MTIYPLNINDSFINNKSILITGGTGSFGNQMVKTLLQFNPRKIIVFSRDEYKQYEMKKKFNPKKYTNMRYLIGDIRDLERLKFAFKDVDLIFHAAALKQVPAMEYNPSEAIKTNIYGAENVIKAAIINNVSNVIAISTDKAVSPVNLYGATKMCFEKLFIANDFSLASNSECTKFSVMRYGNVFGSRGSVIPLFLKQEKEGLFTVTHPEMTRFTITLEDAINFVLNCSEKMLGGETFIPILPSYTIKNLAHAINSNIPIKNIGIREGEKMHEYMISDEEVKRSLIIDDFYVIIDSKRFNCREAKSLYEKHYNSSNYLDEHKKNYNSLENEHIDITILQNMIKEYSLS